MSASSVAARPAVHKSLVIDFQGIKKTEIRDFVKYICWNQMSSQCFLWDPGKGHYRLLAYLSNQLEPGDKVADLGTFHGASAIALAVNPGVAIATYDIEDQVPTTYIETYRNLPNIKFINKDCRNAVKEIAKSKLIYLDIAPHDGMQERDIIEQLIALKYKGIVVVDDIQYNDAMRDFFDWLPLKKLDISAYGSHSGTGIVIFDPKFIDAEIK